MKKFGFTLAEVLITLGIIGVVASLTAPALTKNTGAAKIGPKLAKFVNTFETATEQMMHDEGVSMLSDIGPFNSSNNTDSSNLLNILSSHLIMTPLLSKPISSSYMLCNYDCSSNNGSYGVSRMYQLKDGSLITVLNDAGNSYWLKDLKYSAKYGYKGYAGALYYDINGYQDKNYAGKDLFLFIVDESGLLVPFGSSAYKNLTGKTTYDCSKKKSSFINALACTGQIADNNYKYESK